MLALREAAAAKLSSRWCVMEATEVGRLGSLTLMGPRPLLDDAGVEELVLAAESLGTEVLAEASGDADLAAASADAEVLAEESTDVLSAESVDEAPAEDSTAGAWLEVATEGTDFSSSSSSSWGSVRDLCVSVREGRDLWGIAGGVGVRSTWSSSSRLSETDGGGRE